MSNTSPLLIPSENRRTEPNLEGPYLGNVVSAGSSVTYNEQMPRSTTIERALAERREQILQLAASRNACNVQVFSSVAHGKAKKNSDIDILVDVETGRSLLDVIGLWLDLEALLGRKVDLVTEGGVNRHLRESILAEARPV